MITVYKYPLTISSQQEISIYSQHKILSVGEQNEILCMWAQVDTDNEIVNLPILIFGTGHPMPDKNMNFVGSVLTARGFVWHIFTEPQS